MRPETIGWSRRTNLVPQQRSSREPVPDLRPVPGLYLVAGINASLTALSAASFDTWQLADDLKTALARTAACGDTCRVRPAADAVRAAANLLYAGAPDEARPVLLHARSLLANHSLSRPTDPAATAPGSRPNRPQATVYKADYPADN